LSFVVGVLGWLAFLVVGLGGGLLVLSGMLLMALNTWKTYQLAKHPAAQPILAPDASEALVSPAGA
jgi:cytochrome c oxidase cbb3-type subunit 1